MSKKVLILLLGVLIAAQLFRPERNVSDDQTHALGTKYVVPANIEQLLTDACNDCHSNKTTYPWYANFQPVSGWLAHHVDDGKRELNLSTFARLPLAVQNHKFEEIAEQVEDQEMPLSSYTFLGLHPKANLTDQQREQLVAWARAQMQLLKDRYPADSLVLKRR